MKTPTAIAWDERLPESDKALIDKLNASVDRLDTRRTVEIAVSGLFARSKLAWKIATYQHALLHRVIALMDGAALGWNNRNTLAAMLAARALMETVAVFAELENRVQRFLTDEDLAGLDLLAQNGIFASRDPGWLIEAPETRAVNAQTYVDKFDKRAEGYRGHYDRLSERCHPNAAGHSQLFSKLDRSDGTVRYCDEFYEERNAHMVFAALAILPLVEKISTRLDELIQQVADLQHRLHPVSTEAM
ncbi:MAG: hypothetical protein KGJ78_14405 [Alphaproteobacteria bacterium]|nr:hypothetical protein [Alphaproteobacteria bacterium]